MFKYKISIIVLTGVLLIPDLRIQDYTFKGIQYMLPFFFSIYIVLTLIQKKYSSVSFKFLTGAFQLFFALILSLMLYSYLMDNSIRAIIGKSQYWLFACLIFWFLSRYKFTEKDLQLIAKGMFIWSIFIGFIYIYIYFWGDFGVNFGSLFLKKNHLGNIRIIGQFDPAQFVLIGFAVNFFYKLVKIPKEILIFSIVLYILCFFMHQTRTYLISTICLFPFFFFFPKQISFPFFKFLLITGTLLILVSVLAFVFPIIIEVALERNLTLLGNINEINEYRGRQTENIWALSLFKENPFTGVGFGSNSFYQPKFLSGDTVPIYGVHNNYFFLLAGFGIFGLILYLLISVVFIIITFRNIKTIKAPFLKLVFISSGLMYLAKLIQGWATMNVSGTPFVFMSFLIGLNIAILNIEKNKRFYSV